MPVRRIDQQPLYDAIDAAPAVPEMTPRDVGEAAAQRCAEAAIRRGWDAAEARRLILDALGDRGPTSGEDLVDLACARMERPHDARAFGAVFGALSRERRIVKHGHTRRRKGHGTAGGLVWRLAAGTDNAATNRGGRRYGEKASGQATGQASGQATGQAADDQAAAL
jgi:hypothetical protein